MTPGQMKAFATIMQPKVDQGQMELKAWLSAQPQEDVVTLLGHFVQQADSLVGNDAIAAYFAIYGLGKALEKGGK
ncbi:MAG TPA: hypothetical protein VM011_03810 [Gammaproteobacteria bacterium]|nr:hypothetical protein [Gammaproteobacteria bacterium]